MLEKFAQYEIQNPQVILGGEKLLVARAESELE